MQLTWPVSLKQKRISKNGFAIFPMRWEMTTEIFLTPQILLWKLSHGTIFKWHADQ